MVIDDKCLGAMVHGVFYGSIGAAPVTTLLERARLAERLRRHCGRTWISPMRDAPLLGVEFRHVRRSQHSRWATCGRVVLLAERLAGTSVEEVCAAAALADLVLADHCPRVNDCWLLGCEILMPTKLLNASTTVSGILDRNPRIHPVVASEWLHFSLHREVRESPRQIA